MEPYTVLKHHEPETVFSDGTVLAEFAYFAVAFMGEEIEEGPACLAGWSESDLANEVALLNHGYRVGRETTLTRVPSRDSGSLVCYVAERPL